jgi:single-strand DNA-binding protein
MVNINFIGRLGADAELKTAKSGRQYVSMRVATDEFKKGEKSTSWLNVTYTGDRALKMHEYLKKGSAIVVMGVETVDTYQSTKTGETMISRDVIADRVDFVGLGKSGDTQSNEATADTAAPTKDNTKEMATVAASTTAEDDLPF